MHIRSHLQRRGINDGEVSNAALMDNHIDTAVCQCGIRICDSLCAFRMNCTCPRRCRCIQKRWSFSTCMSIQSPTSGYSLLSSFYLWGEYLPAVILQVLILLIVLFGAFLGIASPSANDLGCATMTQRSMTEAALFEE